MVTKHAVYRITSQKHFDQIAQEACEWMMEYVGCWTWRDQNWITATDLVRRIRAAICEIQQGAELGSFETSDRYGEAPLMVKLPFTRNNLLGCTREWLYHQVSRGRLQVHNFDKGRCSSGARFRPVGEKLTKAEQKTMETTREERWRKKRGMTHVSLEQADKWGVAVAIKLEEDAVCGYRYRRSWYRSYGRRVESRWASDPASVTCKNCLKRMIACYLEQTGLANSTNTNIAADEIEDKSLLIPEQVAILRTLINQLQKQTKQVRKE